MSISRGNWSTLSRTAQQWLEDDEEEQVRERRRRNRDIPSAKKVVEVIPETGSSNLQPVSSVASHKEKKELLNKAQPENLQPQNIEKSETPEQHNESNKVTSTEVDENKVLTTETLEVKQPDSVKQEKQKLTGKNEEIHNHVDTNNGILIQKENTSDSKKERIFSTNQQCLESEDAKGTLQSHQNVRKLNQIFSNWKEKDNTVIAQNAKLKETSSQMKKIHEEEKTEISDMKTKDHSSQGKDSSAPYSDPVSTTPSEPQNETNTSSHGSQTKYKTQVYVSSMKIPRRSSSSCSIKSPPPVPEAIEEEPSPDSKAVKSEVFISAVSSSHLNSKQDSLPNSQQTSTSFVRLGPLSSSVRVKSQSEDDKEDSGFTRRSSLRLSLRSRKIDDRMEKYTSAIQRSASVRIPSSQSRGAIGASDGVASKRSIFEKDDENSAKSNISQKDLALSGSVTSRINQWSNKVQQSSGSATSTKDFKTGDVATKRMLWQQKSESSSDTKL
ncbi:ladinin-1 [Mantella aurantiaca]